ncbi:hypothetical protein Aple_031410 [Acrocarpospora pleiomorpha]|uniref:Lipoprotein n=1 Tax=Acrocarpospora pleiomorpha TaxID=90975 RepID=A0A5M3XF67_9ACTN|nr:hypothetical protein [Acrocarpospora pleiomorpha]GES20245.1 hypothetical protein Aple_031410 [Acrocarpospora pleiomorpha]
MRIHLAIGLLIGVLAGCGQTAADTGVASLKDSATPSASSSPSASADPRAFAQCMRNNGVDMPDPGPNGAFDGLLKSDAARQPKFQQALEACRSLAPVGDIDPKDPEVQEAMRQFAQCMRANGVDMPDPDPASGRIAAEGLNRSDPKVLKAFDACQDKLSPLTGGK